MALSAEELQLGDWVISDGEPHKVCVLRRFPEGHTIGCHGKYGEFFDNINKITPIPLTPEILEKNGWGCLPDEPLYDWWSWRHNGCMLYLNLCGDTAEIEIFGREIYIRYVHELQRLLRCCGLWELADNFKVE